MTLDELNIQLSRLAQQPGREEMLRTAQALVKYIGLRLPENNQEQGILPNKQELKRYLVQNPRTRQGLLYRFTEKGQNIHIILGVLKKIRKDQLIQLIDKENLLCFQKDPPFIQGRPSANPYLIYFATTEAFDRLYVVLFSESQKRILSLRNKLTQTQYQKIFPQWQDIAQKSKPEIAARLWKSLDLKEVNKEFYRQIKEQFDALVAIALQQYPKAVEKDIKQFAVRLIGRYVFCWFLKEKGIIPLDLLSSEAIAKKPDYCNHILRPLFFNTLNTPVPERDKMKSPGPLLKELEAIPYLNGGLFELHPEDALFDQLSLNDWLKAFVKVLEDFDFTVDESSTQYQQVSIDPEMLGRIFENLLASQNEETEKLANQRKAYGAFYTPREIVDYMVNESLKAHLETHILPALPDMGNAFKVEEPEVAYRGTLFEQLESRQTILPLSGRQQAALAEAERKREMVKAKIEKLFAPDCTENPFDKNETQQIRRGLRELTVLDPACGSGAFPMGVLLRLMELRQIVGHGHRNNYDLKSEILSKNIFGVDIMPMAVEIARLRAWLSLVLEADYKPTDRKNNFGVAALPNLDFKFVCANSLIDSGYDAFLEKIKLTSQRVDNLLRLNESIKMLEQIREDYYDPKGDKILKDELKEKFKDTKDFIKQKFGDQKTIKELGIGDFLSKVDDWDPFDDSKPSSFFSSAWMFGIRDGFDVVIGNPPYVQLQNNSGKWASMYQDQKYQTFARTGDIYSLFYEKGNQILKEKGVLSFITSNKWMRAAYGEKLRKYFTSEMNPLKLIDFGGYQVFDATVDTNILIAKKAHFQSKVQTCVLNKDFSLSNISDYFRQN
ncbi:MAG TPA: Eco57I restriction-modification methylase domain-containing protein, partial [Chitinophagaceae bacterium]